jgi:hypothetical protein
MAAAGLSLSVWKERNLRYRNRILALTLTLMAPASLLAAEITGTVTNGTMSKPAKGAEVVLLSLAGGMEEAGKATTDGQGHFSIHVPDPGVPHLLRVSHQGVNYFQNAPPGSSNSDITIYDSAKQVEGIFEDARVYRMQTQNGQLEVMATYTLRNESSPPRTKMDNETFTVDLPPRARLEDATAAGPSGMPLATSPVPTGKPNQYGLVFPIRPGKTQFTVSYKVPYEGSFEFAITPDSQLSELGVLLPKSMKFAGLSRPFAQDTDEAGLAVFFTKNVSAHELVRFSVTGEGIAPREAQGGGGEPPSGAPAGGAPAESSGGSGKMLWYVAAVMVLIVAGGGFWLWRRSWQKNSAGASGKAASPKTSARAQAVKPSAGKQPRSSPAAAQADLLEVLKDELFQLERDRAEGKVPQEQYEKTKAGLDALIRRQLKKTGQA